jgi:hypothetical protein
MELVLPSYDSCPGICPLCNNWTWLCSKSIPIESSQYSTQIYNERMQCGNCRYYKDILRPCMSPPWKEGMNK